jgi:hypothetical protein
MADNEYQDNNGDQGAPDQPLTQDYGTPVAPPPAVDDQNSVAPPATTPPAVEDVPAPDQGVSGPAEVTPPAEADSQSQDSE